MWCPRWSSRPRLACGTIDTWRRQPQLRQEIEFDRCDVVVTGSRAVATCRGRARYVPKVGNKSAHVESRQWRFDLRKANESWRIETVSAR